MWRSWAWPGMSNGWGASHDHWLLRTQTGVVLTLDGSPRGWPMEADARLVRKTAANGKRWVCDASMRHCIRTGDVERTLMADRSKDEEKAP